MALGRQWCRVASSAFGSARASNPADLFPGPIRSTFPSSTSPAPTGRGPLAGVDPVAFARFLGLDAIIQGQNGVIRRDQPWLPESHPFAWTILCDEANGCGSSRGCSRSECRRRHRGSGSGRRGCGPGTRRRSPGQPPPGGWAWHRICRAKSRSSFRRRHGAPALPSVRVIRGRVDTRDTDFEDWIRVTTIPRTCLDLARQGEPDRLESAFRRRRTDSTRLQEV